MDPVELTAAEVGAALRISRLSATRRTELALEVCARLPGTLAALASGQISMAKLRVIVEATEVLSSEHAAAVEQRVLVRAPSQTPAGLGASAARAVIRTDPSAAERRRLEAVRERSVAMFPGTDGIATLWLRAPAARVMNACRRIVEVAESARTPADERSADARRADTLLDLILDPFAVLGLSTVDAAQAGAQCSLGHRGGGVAHRDDAASAGDVPSNRLAPRSLSGGSRPRWEGARGTVHVTVARTTLAGLDPLRGQLAGYGPVTAEFARELAGDATWRRILTDPATGAVLDVGTTTYSPPAALAAHVRARDGACRWPGCRHPARRCDLDHTGAFHADRPQHTTWQRCAGSITG